MVVGTGRQILTQLKPWDASGVPDPSPSGKRVHELTRREARMSQTSQTTAKLDARRQRIVDAIAPANLESNPVALVPGEVLLATLWPDQTTRPTMRWLRKMTATRSFPFVKLGNRVWFDVQRVRRQLDKTFTVEAFSL